MYCRKCGNQINEDSRFCTYCGFPTYRISETVSEEQIPDRKRSRKGILFLLTLVFLIAAGLGSYLGWNSWSHWISVTKHREYTVSFHCLTDNAAPEHMPADQTIAYGETASPPPFPVREGYIFDAWYLDQGCTKAYDFTTAVKEDTVLFAGWIDETSEEAQLTQEAAEDYLERVEELTAIYDSCAEENGYILPEHTQKTLDSLETFVKEQQKAGYITYYSRGENNLYLEFSSRLTYVCSIPEEGAMNDPSALPTTMMFPFSDTDPYFPKLDQDLTASLNQWGGYELQDFWNEDVTPKSLMDQPESQLYIWTGHGDYTPELHSFLSTNQKVNPANLVLNYKLLAQKYIAVQNGRYVITPEAVKAFFPSLDGGLVILNACSSGKDDALASAFRQLGADVVLAYDGTVNCWYSYVMTYFILRYMNGQGEDGVYHTFAEALSLAEKDLGKSCNQPAYAELILDRIRRDQNVYEVALQYYEDPIIHHAEGSFLFNRLSHDCATKPVVYSDSAETYTLWAGLTGRLASENQSIPVEGIELTLVDESGAIAGTAVSDAEGSFLFNRLSNDNTCRYTLTGRYNGRSVLAKKNISCSSHCVQNLGELMLEDTLSLYADVVKQYEETYGTLTFHRSRFQNYQGVFLLDPVDFDQDGTEELVIGYAKYQPSLEISWPYMDVWTIKDGVPVLAYEGAIIEHSDIGRHCEYTDWNGSYYLVQGYAGSGMDLSLLKMENGAFTTAVTLEVSDANYTHIAYLNGAIVDYDALYRLYHEIENGSQQYYGHIIEGYSPSASDILEYLNEIRQRMGLDPLAANVLAAYADFLRSYSSSSQYEHPVFQLIYVDDDDIPELTIAEDNIHASGVSIYTFYEGAVTLLGQFGGYGTCQYSRRNNLIQYT
ncbi:MAG: InlB B-repeat-containing protein, partial [Lachnospiraceae bacterium]|nr:InlB B-repeat-containing protein [Lachnospiraceae bacterium]